jgi:ribosomal protein L7/L12
MLRRIQPHVTELVEKIASLSLLDVADLNYALKKRLNIPDQPVFAPGAFAAQAPAAG